MPADADLIAVAPGPPRTGPMGRWPWLALCGAGGLALLALPFAALVTETPWRSFHLSQTDLGSVAVSGLDSALALAIIVALGTPAAYWLARRRFRGKMLAEIALLLPLLAPPLAMGVLLATIYGPYGWLGGPAAGLGIRLVNTPAAFVLAQVYAAAPYYIVTARAAFANVPAELEQVSLTLGRSRARTFLSITLPLARMGLAAGLALAWVRAIGEFGIAVLLAYFPKGIPVELWTNLQDSGIDAVYPLLWALLLVALPLPLVLGLVARRKGDRDVG